MQTELRFLGQPVDLETPNCAPPQNTAGANRDDIIMKHVSSQNNPMCMHDGLVSRSFTWIAIIF